MNLKPLGLFRHGIFFSLFFFPFISSFASPKKDLSLEKIQNEKTLKVCSDAGFLPFEMRTKKGDWIGFDVDMMRAFSKYLNVNLEMLQVNFDGIIPALIAGKCNLIAAGMTVTPQREAVVSFSEPTFSNGLMIALKKTEKNTIEYKDLNSLDKHGLKIAVKTGYTSDIYITKQLKFATVLRFDTDADMVLAVKQGRAVAFVSDTTYVNIMSDENKDWFLTLQTPVTAEHFSIAAKKADLALLAKFNEFMAFWRKSGDYDKSKEYYFKDQLWRFSVNPS